MKSDEQVDPAQEKNHGYFELRGGSGKEQWTRSTNKKTLQSPNYAVLVLTYCVTHDWYNIYFCHFSRILVWTFFLKLLYFICTVEFFLPVQIVNNNNNNYYYYYYYWSEYFSIYSILFETWIRNHIVVALTLKTCLIMRLNTLRNNNFFHRPTTFFDTLKQNNVDLDYFLNIWFYLKV